MSRGRGQGAPVHVQRALGWTGEPTRSSRAETAPCQVCGADLRFTTGEYGQTLEICTNRHCVGARPHRPLPDPALNRRPKWGK